MRREDAMGGGGSETCKQLLIPADLSLLDNVVWVTAREASTLQ